MIAKTSVTNIVKEAFSKSTARFVLLVIAGLWADLVTQSRLPRVHEVQCQLLLSSSKDEGIAKATKEHIRSLADGQAPRNYTALSLGFKMAIEAKRVAPSETKALVCSFRSFNLIITEPPRLGSSGTGKSGQSS